MPRPVEQTSAELVDELPAFRISDEVAAVASEVIREHETAFGWIPEEFRVAYLLKLGDKPAPDDTIDTVAKCVKAPALWNVLAGYDFAIWVKECYWILFPERARAALLSHELSHIGISDKGKPTTTPHTIEEFAQVAAWYGPWSGSLRHLYRALAESGHEPPRQASAEEIVDGAMDVMEAEGFGTVDRETRTVTVDIDEARQKRSGGDQPPVVHP